MTEQWIKWEPIDGLSKKYYLEDICDSNVFIIFLSDNDNKKIKLIFENGVGSYIRTNETLRYKTILWLDNKYGTRFYAEWSFFKVENSNYLKWISEQSCGISDYGRNYMHFSFIVIDSVIDVISGNEPKIEFVK